ncbi:sensor histidine kinase [Sphingomonas adhaesiva]|uniref:sensor histidine kinase n=1 Tax=Sphingomonas adhaesiva TaxID=28212 RepID=UPI002FFD11F5
MVRRIWNWRKSMFAQIALLTLLFLGWGLYSFVIRPIADMPIATQRSPEQATTDRLRSVLHAFVLAERETPGKPPALATDPLIRAIEARNPGFRYYVRADDRAFGNGDPVYFRRFGFDRLAQVHRTIADPAICSQASKLVPQRGHTDYADFYMCDRLSYFEYRGLERPVIVNEEQPLGAMGGWLAWFSGNFLLAAGGVFLIFALIFTLHILSLRRVATLARSIDPQRLDAKLPEKGVANEILPLVRAVNHLIGQVDAAQRRATFFLSAAAHELRTPLTVLRTRLELMEEGAEKDKLIGDVRRLTRLVNQLLTLMSISNRRDITGFADLALIGRKVTQDLSLLADRTGVTLRFDSAVPVFEIPGDAELIGSAIANLVDNAISFAPEGTSVDVGLSADGTITVRDHGPGLGSVDPDTLFEPFIRPVSNRRGYGLGLAIVSAIVRLHGGRVAAANAPDGGAVFTVTFSDQTINVSADATRLI